jgi:hypothetical protein
VRYEIRAGVQNAPFDGKRRDGLAWRHVRHGG